MASLSPVQVTIGTAGLDGHHHHHHHHHHACAPPAPMPMSSAATAVNSAAESNGPPAIPVGDAIHNHHQHDGDGDDAAVVQRTLNDLRNMGNRLRVASQRHQDMIRATQQRWAEADMGKCPLDALLSHPSPYESPDPKALLQISPPANRSPPMIRGIDGTRGMLPDQPDEQPEQTQQDLDVDTGGSVTSRLLSRPAIAASGLLDGLPPSPPSVPGLAALCSPPSGG